MPRAWRRRDVAVRVRRAGMGEEGRPRTLCTTDLSDRVGSTQCRFPGTTTLRPLDPFHHDGVLPDDPPLRPRSGTRLRRGWSPQGLPVSVREATVRTRVSSGRKEGRRPLRRRTQGTHSGVPRHLRRHQLGPPRGVGGTGLRKSLRSPSSPPPPHPAPTRTTGPQEPRKEESTVDHGDVSGVPGSHGSSWVPVWVCTPSLSRTHLLTP